MSLQSGLNENVLIKFHRGNLQYLLAKLNVISDLNHIDCVSREMNIFSLKLALKAFILLHFGCTPTPRCSVATNILSYACLGHDVVENRLCLLILA